MLPFHFSLKTILPPLFLSLLLYLLDLLFFYSLGSSVSTQSKLHIINHLHLCILILYPAPPHPHTSHASPPLHISTSPAMANPSSYIYSTANSVKFVSLQVK